MKSSKPKITPVKVSFYYSVWNSVWYSTSNSVRDSVYNSVWYLVRDSIRRSIKEDIS